MTEGIEGLFFYWRNGNGHLDMRCPIVSSTKRHQHRNFICQRQK